jgi:hypothetical protein
MKSYGTSFDSLFETYENMRDRSEITAEIEVVDPIVGEEPDLEQDGAIDDMSGVTNHFYHKGYLDALQWVIGDKR